MEEVWKDVVGYEGLYQVSNIGRIKSINYKRTKQCRLLATWLTNNPRGNKGIRKNTVYYRCKIKSKENLVHRLVAQAFIPNPEHKLEVNHIDGNSQNNRVDNLEWATRSENATHANKTGLRKPPKGELSGLAKFSNSEIIELKKIIHSGLFKQKDIAKAYGVAQTTISAIKVGKTWNVDG